MTQINRSFEKLSVAPKNTLEAWVSVTDGACPDDPFPIAVSSYGMLYYF